MRGFVWLEKEVKLEEAAAAAGGEIFRIIMGQQGVSSTIPSLTRHHPLPIHECLGCLRCTQDFKDCGPETFRLGLPKKHWWVMMTPSCSSHTIWCKSCSRTIIANLSMWVMQVMQANSIARISFSLMKWLWWSWLCNQSSLCQGVGQNTGFLYPKVLQYFPSELFSFSGVSIMLGLGFRVQALILATPPSVGDMVSLQILLILTDFLVE